ncbi:MAG: hypothetical protein U0414_04000 [Polyangiaceae bacterium]
MSRHPWMHRFGFPGFAEVDWVLPRDVVHDDPWCEPLPPSFACHDLLGWSLDTLQHDKLRALHFETFHAPLDEPADVPFHALMEPLRGAFERGDLVVWAIRVHAVRSAAELPKTGPQPRPPTTTKSWIEITLVDGQGAPVPNEPYRVVSSQGESLLGTLDGNGFARIDGIAAGGCDVTFPKIDRREWAKRGMLGSATPGNASDDDQIFEPSTEHTVRDGDSMARITRVHRFRHWQTIRGHAKNADLAAKRANPNLFVLGDALFIPEKRLRVEEGCATETRHVFEVASFPCWLRLKLGVREEVAFALDVESVRVREGSLSDGGMIEAPIDALARSGTLTLWSVDEEDRTAENGYALAIDIGGLTAIEAVHGGAGRLTNLGFHRAPLPTKEVDPETEVSISRFQASVPTEVTGAYDAATERDLKAAHDVA